MDSKIDAAIRIRGERGAKDSEHVLALVLLNLAGGTAVDNLSILEKKLSFGRFGIRIPSPSACRLWLKSFHNASEEQKREWDKPSSRRRTNISRGGERSSLNFSPSHGS